jgi:hypothetical protein
MIYTPKEYAKAFKFGGRFVHSATIRRRCTARMLPRGHTARKLPGGLWVIEVNESIINDNISKHYNISIKSKS